MFRIEFQEESVETFHRYEVVQYALSEDLGVIGPPGSVRSVTIKLDFELTETDSSE